MWSDYPCKLLTGATRKGGYGVRQTNGRLVSVHREALELKLGRPLVAHALHHCDNPACYEPEHLFEGTHSRNMRDMFEKGRDGKQHLSASQRAEIRAKYIPYVYGVPRLAAEYGVARCAIWKIVHGKNKVL